MVRNALLASEDVKAGMFPSEKTVVVKDQTGQPFSALIDDAFIIKRGQKQFIRVRIAEIQGKRYLVLLPGEVFGGSRAITVSKDQVQELTA